MKKTMTMMAMLIAVLMVTSCGTRGEDGWMTDFEAAKRLAAKKGVPILADFSGSDWCGWCIKLDQEVFSQKAFADFAADALVLFKADFPQAKPQPEDVARQNKALAEAYRIEGFPTILILDAEGKERARTGYRAGGAAAYVEHIKGLIKK